MELDRNLALVRQRAVMKYVPLVLGFLVVLIAIGSLPGRDRVEYSGLFGRLRRGATYWLYAAIGYMLVVVAGIIYFINR